MESRVNTVRNIIGYALFLMYGAGGLITIGLAFTGHMDLAGLALMFVLAASIIPLFFRLLMHISKKYRSAPRG